MKVVKRNRPKMLCYYGVNEKRMVTKALTYKTLQVHILLLLLFKTILWNIINNISYTIGSWRTGLGFSALIHSHRPDLLNFPSLEKNTNIENLNIAFDVANNELGIPRLLDAEGK